MSEGGPAPDIKPRRVKVAEVPKTDLTGLSPKERAPAEADAPHLLASSADRAWPAALHLHLFL
jgi:hypothetical protein